MAEYDRLKELKEYEILDTPPEKELDDLVEIASAICDTPISLITLIDESRQWLKAKKGIDISEMSRYDSFCQHALNQPKKVLVVEDPENDDRFKDNPFVKEGQIKFYAGAPLETPKGNVLGTLCIVDNKPNKIKKSQRKALKLLADKAMKHLNTRKSALDQEREVAFNASKLKKLADQIPGAIYQFEMSTTGKMFFHFISRGISSIHPDLDPQLIRHKPEVAFEVIHPDDLLKIQSSIQESFQTLSLWNVKYRIISKDSSNISWHWGLAQPERLKDGSVIWYGIFQDITEFKESEIAVEQIVSDISSSMNEPLSTLRAIANVLDDQDEESESQLYANQIRAICQKMDEFSKDIHQYYRGKRDKNTQ